jgi:hypothetical protein
MQYKDQMTDLTPKQRVKINAALTSIHATGHDASAVTAYAKQLASAGEPAHRAYNRAINRFIIARPEMERELQMLTRLIDASDDATVAQYNTALTAYNETGDKAAIMALAPTIARDSLALAVKLGEVTPGEVLDGGLEAALGYAPSDAMMAAFNDAPPAASPEPVKTAAPAEQFAFVPADDTGALNDRKSAYWSEAGYMAPKRGEAKARWEGTTLAEALAVESAQPAA